MCLPCSLFPSQSQGSESPPPPSLEAVILDNAASGPTLPEALDATLVRAANAGAADAAAFSAALPIHLQAAWTALHRCCCMGAIARVTKATAGAAEAELWTCTVDSE